MLSSIKHFAIICLSIFLLPSGQAQSQFEIGNDLFLSGTAPVHSSDGIDDLFMSGETVRSTQPISGSAHLAGRKVVLDGAVGGDLYAGGFDISINAPVAGDVTVAGYDVSIADVGGDLRLVGSKLSLLGTVNGNTVITGDRVRFDAEVKGDVSLTSQDVTFMEGAYIEGQLLLFEDRVGSTEIPESVVPDARIERRPAPGSEAAIEDLDILDRRHPVMKFMSRLLFVGVMVGLVAALLPNSVATLRDITLRKPLSSFWIGFLALSTASGSAIVLMITGFAFVLVPVSLLVAFVGALSGYFLGVYLLGTGLLSALGRHPKAGVSGRLITAATGALTATIISRIPLLGWLGTLVIVLVGLGALTVWIFRPKFFAAV